MTSALVLLQQAAADGVEINLTRRGTVKVRGSQDAVRLWLPILRERKPDLLEALTRATDDEATRSTPQQQVTDAEVAALRGLIRTVYANDSDEDRAEALKHALMDAASALICYRLLAREYGWNQ